jgi:dihydrofolate synthase/folylpolyglutamate synthase
MNYQQSLTRLFDLQKFGIKVGLDSMNRLLDSLGRPEKDGRFVHIAGTNGKGSTAAMLSNALAQGGYRVGLYTSPHLVTFRERIQINSVMISADDTIDLFNRVWAVIDETSPPTFFEFVTAMAFLYFQDQKLDLAVIETGLGGRLDSTNVIDPLITAITNVSLEHTEYLGNTIEEIAGEKAGIIKKGVPFVGGRFTPEVAKVVGGRIKETGVQAKMLDQDFRITIKKPGPQGPIFDYHGPKWDILNLSPGLAGPYQAENGALAAALAESLDTLGFPLSIKALQKGLNTVKWPGRAELFPPHTWPLDHSAKSSLVLDGAHNPGGAQAFRNYLKDAVRGQLHLVVGVMADKDVAGVLGPLVPLANRLYLTRPEYARAAAPEELLARLTAALGSINVPTTICPTIPEALSAAALEAKSEDLVVVSGSLFTVGETRAYLTGEPVVESN